MPVSSSSLARVTEDSLSAAFDRAISHGLLSAYYPRFQGVVKEMVCQQGRPDFVAECTYEEVGVMGIRSQSGELAEGALSGVAIQSICASRVHRDRRTISASR